MNINYTNKKSIASFVEDNIKLINDKISLFSEKSQEKDGVKDAPVQPEIKEYLSTKLFNEFPEKKEELYKELSKVNFVKSRIKNIANKYIYYKNDLEEKYEEYILEKFKNSLKESITEEILQTYAYNSNFPEKEFNFIKNKLNKIIDKTNELTLSGGFPKNLTDVNSGIMTANAGDSAQFLFLARAILAGFNSSNVDVRASRYDAIVDYQGKLFKIQVKGISGNTVSFIDRTRGGRGIDQNNPHNQGKRITSKDCDIYVAVDKQVGLCYLIPMNEIDLWEYDEIKKVPIKKIIQYKEYWDIFKELNQKKKRGLVSNGIKLRKNERPLDR